MNVLDAPESPILARRLERDVKSRGYSVERVMRLFLELKRDSEKFIEPARGVAVIVMVMVLVVGERR
jgi:uridine kinase